MTQSKIRPSEFIHLYFWPLPMFLFPFNKFAHPISLSIHTNRYHNHKNTVLSGGNGARQVKTDKQSKDSNGNWVTRPNCAIEQITWYVNANIAGTEMIDPRPKFHVYFVTKKIWRLPDSHYGGKLIPQSGSRDDNDIWIICEIWVFQSKMAIKS